MQRPPTQNEQEQQYNRLFILGGKGCSEDDWRTAFEKFGSIKDIWMVKDRATNEEKGICYITFSKASEAALAIEDMNGRFLANNPKPLKVILASHRREGNARDAKEDEKMLRIFIMVPKTETKEEIKNTFEEYGGVEYVRLLQDPRTGKSKGLAFVKFYRAYHAALAIEECDTSYKAVFANAQKRDRPHHDSEQDFPPVPMRGGGGGGGGGGGRGGLINYEVDPYPPRNDYAMPPPPPMHGHSTGASLDVFSNFPHTGQTLLEVRCSSTVTEEQLHRLFDIVPGLQRTTLDVASGIVVVQYSHPSYAAYAKSKLAGFEYPPGYRLAIRFPQHDMNMGRPGGDFETPNTDMKVDIDAINQSLQSAMSGGSTVESIQMLASSLKQATELIQKTGLSEMASGSSGGISGGAGGGVNPDGTVNVRYCNVPLPTKKPYAPRESVAEERLFIVSQPDAFTEDILRDAMVRFGSLIDCYFMPGKNYGYAKYASKECARTAVEVLHGQSICNMRLKVILADPPRYDGEPDPKRQRNN